MKHGAHASSTFNYRLCLWVVLLVVSHASFAQNKDLLELMPGSERLTYDRKLDANMLAGNVHFVYQGNNMYCDSAVYFKKKDFVKAYGHVHINKKGEMNLFCDSLWYDGKTEIARLWSNVRARDQEYKLTTDSMTYNAKTECAIYRKGGKVESIDGKEVLVSQIGYFYPNKKDFFFKNDVLYTGEDVVMTTDTLQYSYLNKRLNFFGPTDFTSDSTDIYCESGYYLTDTEEAELRDNAKIVQKSQFVYGDTLQYTSSEKLAIGRGNVCVEDTVEQFYFIGDYLYKNDSIKRMFMTGHALAVKANKDDSLYIHADTLFSYGDSTEKPTNILAYHEVKIFQNKLQGQCDSLIYTKSLDRLDLYHKPILWTEKGELKGDTIFVYLKDSIVDRAELFLNATALFEVDSGAYYNQIAGKRMTAIFKENQVSRADVNGNAQTIYFPEENEDTDTAVVVKRQGMNRLYASDLRVYLDSGEVQGITYFKQPDGVMYPIDQIPKAEQFVPNFEWNPKLRPKSWATMILEESDLIN